MSTPFDPQPLTADQQKQIADRVEGTLLIQETLKALAQAKVDFSKAEAVSVEFTHQAQVKLPPEVDVEGMLKAETAYFKAFDLVRDLGYYFGGAKGWIGGVGQPNHET